MFAWFLPCGLIRSSASNSWAVFFVAKTQKKVDLMLYCVILFIQLENKGELDAIFELEIKEKYRKNHN